MIYKCTSDKCNCKVVAAHVYSNGWNCLECGAEYIHDNTPLPPLLDPAEIGNVRMAFKELSAEEQRICIKSVILEHAYYSGLAGLDILHTDPLEITNAYREGESHRKD